MQSENSTDSDHPVAASSGARPLPPVLGELLRGTAWMALQIALSFWSLRLIVQAIGPDRTGADRFAVGFGLFQLLFALGSGPALQQYLSDAWTPRWPPPSL